MKNKIILSALLMLTASFAFAQGKKNAAGVYIGPNFPKYDISSLNLSADGQTGFQIGAFYRKGGLLYGQAGLEYQRLKSYLIATDSFGSSSGAVDINRVQMPLYLGLKLLGVRAYAGPTISYTVAAPSFNPEFDQTDFKRFGVNGTVGGGIDIIIFSVDAGYTFGLTNLFSDNYDGNANYVFLNLGLKF